MHMSLVSENYKDAPEYFCSKFREDILQGKIVKGMWPTETLLAGGGGVYKVKEDVNVWSKGSNPMEVMKAQSLKPDNSAIEITFQNSNQFIQDKPCKFTVFFGQGVVVDIKER